VEELLEEEDDLDELEEDEDELEAEEEATLPLEDPAPEDESEEVIGWPPLQEAKAIAEQASTKGKE
jgi:hypothetical protein